jgi:ABC-2 type transport system permease protein
MTQNAYKAKLALMRAGLKVGLAYRLDYIVHLFSVPVNTIIYYFLWKAIFEYSGQTVIRGFTLEEMVTYYVIIMIVSFITWTDVDQWIEQEVLQGNMIGPLMKPVSYLENKLYFTIGTNLLGILIQFLPVIIIGSLIGITLVKGWYILLFIISVAIAGALFFLFSYLLGLSSFWLKRIKGMRRMQRSIIWFLSGSFIPLTFFPQGVQRVFEYLPFMHIKYVPVTIYLGKIGVTDALFSLSVGLAWAGVLYLLALVVWKRAFKKFSGAGT